MSAICVVDTSVFCELLDVPSMASRRERIVAELRAKIEAHEELLLPMTTILETGNHIGHNGDGTLRRRTARRFVEHVERALAGDTPFTPTPLLKEQELIQLLARFPDWAGRGSGFGDLTIVGEWEALCALYPARRVYIWSLDTHLRSYDQIP